MSGFYRVIFIILSFVLIFNGAAHSSDIKQSKTAIFISQPIRPYLIAAEGLREELVRSIRAEIEEFDLKGLEEKDYDILTEDLVKNKFDVFIAIGPAAAEFVWSSFPSPDVKKLYTMVLDHEGIQAPLQSACGITLRIPIGTQLQLISLGLPGVKRIGIPYDPVYNAEIVKQAVRFSSGLGLSIIPLEISSKKEIPSILNQNWSKLDALLLIPDRTIISESIIQYIIKEALLNKVAVIGYNKFFYESGAALAFPLDYREIGEQTGRMARKILSGERCEKELPEFHAWINERVIRKLGIEPVKKYQPPLEAGP
jgi:putative tryptophan/tyrosine transport system substrate-binding protein